MGEGGGGGIGNLSDVPGSYFVDRFSTTTTEESACIVVLPVSVNHVRHLI